MSDPVVDLMKEGCETLEFHVGEITPHSVGHAFQLDPHTIWLKEEVGRRCYFPDSSGKFNFSPDIGRLVFSLLVEGAPFQAQTIPVATAPCVPGPSYQTQPLQPSYKPILGSRKRDESNVKVVKATMTKLSNGKVKFDSESQTFVKVTEASANVPFILNAIKRSWGESYTLVSSDGLEIQDSSGTQGLEFWKVGSRKVYAVPHDDQPHTNKSRSKKRGHRIVLDSDSDSEADFLPPKKNTCAASACEVNSLKKEVTAMRDELHSLFKIDRRMKIPVALHSILQCSFKCHICQSAPMCPPVIFARCCKSIIGCETCVDTWYRGEDGMSRNCPRCSTERALPDTMRFHGLDDFLMAIRPLIDDPQQADE